MKNPGMLPYIILIGFLLSLAGILLAQSTPDRTLFVNGKPAGSVTQVAGHSYIDIDTVAQITNGTITVEPTRILLNIPVRDANHKSVPRRIQHARAVDGERRQVHGVRHASGRR